MCQASTPWEKCVEFHGHVCPGLTLGYKAAVIALQELGVNRAEDEELLCLVENDACGVDALQVLTGCTLGKGNLIYKDYGKQVYTIANRRTGEAVRVSVKPGVLTRDAEHRALQAKVMQEEASQDEKELFWQKHRGLADKIMGLSDEEFCTVKRVELELPSKARIFETIICSNCGEGVMEPRARLKAGKPVCLECAGQEYSRGW